MKEITVRVSDHEYLHLNDLARLRSTTVTDVATGAVRMLAAERIGPRDEAILRAHREGLTTGEIGARLGMTNRAVADRYRPLRLSANPRLRG